MRRGGELGSAGPPAGIGAHGPHGYHPSAKGARHESPQQGPCGRAAGTPSTGKVQKSAQLWSELLKEREEMKLKHARCKASRRGNHRYGSPVK